MRGLNKLYYIKKDIEEIKFEIKNIPEISGINISGMPHTNNISDPVYSLVVKRESLLKKLYNKIERYYDELLRVEEILDGVEDIEIRAMARMRFINHMKWEDIGDKLNYDRTTCSKKVREYFEASDIQHSHNSHL